MSMIFETYIMELGDNHAENVEILKDAKNKIREKIKEIENEIKTGIMNNASKNYLSELNDYILEYKQDLIKLDAMHKSEYGKSKRQEKNPNYKERKKKPENKSQDSETANFDYDEGLIMEVDTWKQSFQNAISQADNKNVARVLQQILNEQLEEFDGDFYEMMSRTDFEFRQQILNDLQETLKYYTIGDELEKRAMEIGRAFANLATGFSENYQDMLIQAAEEDSEISYSNPVYARFFKRMNL